MLRATDKVNLLIMYRIAPPSVHYNSVRRETDEPIEIPNGTSGTVPDRRTRSRSENDPLHFDSFKACLQESNAINTPPLSKGGHTVQAIVPQAAEKELR